MSYVSVGGRVSTVIACCIAQDFGGRKVWQILWFMTNPLKFYPPTTLFLTDLATVQIGTSRLCQHNFGHNRYIKELSIM